MLVRKNNDDLAVQYEDVHALPNCPLKEGDCDNDDECQGNLKCGQGSGLDYNCGSTFPSRYDCCYDPEKRK
jgi:hypothetical protein